MKRTFPTNIDGRVFYIDDDAYKVLNQYLSELRNAFKGEEGEEIISAQLPSLRVLDVCTGSGCIACAIASEYPAAKVLALDIADEALHLAKENVDGGLIGGASLKAQDFSVIVKAASK